MLTTDLFAKIFGAPKVTCPKCKKPIYLWAWEYGYADSCPFCKSPIKVKLRLGKMIVHLLGYMVLLCVEAVFVFTVVVYLNTFLIKSWLFTAAFLAILLQGIMWAFRAVLQNLYILTDS